MRSSLLVSAAILVAGVAIASAQNAPGGAGQERNQARSQNHRATGAVTHGVELPLRTRTTGFGFQDGLAKGLKNGRSNPQYATAKRHGESLPGQASLRPRNVSATAPTPAKRNYGSVQQRRGYRGRSMAGGRSIWDRTMAQGRIKAEQGRIGQSDRHGLTGSLMRTGQLRTALLTKGRQDLARNQDLVRNKASRRPPDQAMGRASEQKLHSTHNQHISTTRPRSVALRRERQRGGTSHTGQAEIRKVQAALNQQGFNIGHPDGKLGQRTKTALIAFQKQRGLKTTGKVDPETLHAIRAGGSAPVGSRDNNQLGAEKGAAPSQVAPQAAEPSTTGQSGAAPQPATASPQPTDGKAPSAPGGLQMPESGASGRVPAGSPQEEDKDDAVPSGGADQR